MLRLILTLGLFGGLLAAGAATADDTPGDKKGPQEMNGAKLFRKIDANGDGKIGKDELKDFLSRVAGNRIKGRERLFNRIFQQADSDGDGYLSPDEFKALVARFRDRFDQRPRQ
jgi:calcium-binding protein CML